MSERYADQRGHDVGQMTAAEREAYGARLAEVDQAVTLHTSPGIPERKIAGAVVVDMHDGYVFWNDSRGQLFTLETARAFAIARNADMKPEHALYVVHTLARV